MSCRQGSRVVRRNFHTWLWPALDASLLGIGLHRNMLKVPLVFVNVLFKESWQKLLTVCCHISVGLIYLIIKWPFD